jgi:hypothetical protein
MRETWIGSGIYSTDLDRRISCESCLNEWDEVVYFDDTGVADEGFICPACQEIVFYFEDRREPKWQE